MVEILHKPTVAEIGSNPSIIVEEAQAILNRKKAGRAKAAINMTAGVQKRIIRQNGYVSNDGEVRSFYLTSADITSELTNSWNIVSAFNDPAVKAVESGEESYISREHALDLLGHACSVKEREIKTSYVNGKVTEAQFRQQMEPVEGLKMAVMSERTPERFNSLVRNLRQA